MPPQPNQLQNHHRLAPVLLPPPRRRRALSTLSIAHGAILDRHAASTPSGTMRQVPLLPMPPLSKDRTFAPALPSRPPRCLGLLSGGQRWTLLRFRRSGDGDGSTLTLTLVTGASGAATTTPDLPGNLRRPWDCWSGLCFWDVFVGMLWLSFFVGVYVRLSLCGGARRQSRATYVACTKCVQVSLSETCKF
jgi:hypothetical protein